MYSLPPSLHQAQGGQERERETHTQTGELPSKLRAVITSSQGGSSIEEEGDDGPEERTERGGKKKSVPPPRAFLIGRWQQTAFLP